jgi:hypothetical protein
MDMHELYEVWHEAGERTWKFKTPHGVETRRTKKDAIRDAEAWEKANANAKQEGH